MILLYLILSCLFLITSTLLIYKPGLVKKLYLMLINNNLIMVYGVVEIAMALGILYFKNNTKFSLIPLLIGILLFIDGILYVIFSSRKEKLLTAILKMKNKTLQKMSLLSLIAAVGLLIAGLTV